MDLQLQVLMEGVLKVHDEHAITVSLARVRGRKFVVEIAGPDNVEHYWCDTLDEAKREFNDCMKVNADELEMPAY